VRINKNNIRKKAEKTEKAALEKAKEEFAGCAGTFSGLYEPIYMMGKGIIKFRAGIMGDWVTRTANLEGAENYKKIWNPEFSDYTGWSQEQGLAKVNELLSFILSAGVCRDTATDITVDSTTYKKYSHRLCVRRPNVKKKRESKREPDRQERRDRATNDRWRSCSARRRFSAESFTCPFSVSRCFTVAYRFARSAFSAPGLGK
jgi:hypothetical protein